MHYDFGIAPAIVPNRVDLQVPAFELTHTWAGVSLMLARYALGNDRLLSLALPIDRPDGANYLLALSWDACPYVHRYKLWDGGKLHFPTYNGQRIGKNARLEVWSMAAGAAENPAPWMLPTSWLLFPVVPDTVFTVPTATLVPVSIGVAGISPDAYCDPLCETPPLPPESIAMFAYQGRNALRAETERQPNQLFFLDYLVFAGDGQGGWFIFKPAEMTADDGADFLQPIDIGIGEPGRFVRTNNP